MQLVIEIFVEAFRDHNPICIAAIACFAITGLSGFVLPLLARIGRK